MKNISEQEMCDISNELGKKLMQNYVDLLSPYMTKEYDSNDIFYLVTNLNVFMMTNFLCKSLQTLQTTDNKDFSEIRHRFLSDMFIETRNRIEAFFKENPVPTNTEVH